MVVLRGTQQICCSDRAIEHFVREQLRTEVERERFQILNAGSFACALRATTVDLFERDAAKGRGIVPGSTVV